MEEAARIVSGGIKPGSGVDLQMQDENGVVQLYAIQSSPNTKNAGGRKSDIDALRRGGRPLRGDRQRVELNIAVLAGRAKTGPLRDNGDITVVGSDEFWQRVGGIPDFRARLLRATKRCVPLGHVLCLASLMQVTPLAFPFGLCRVIEASSEQRVRRCTRSDRP
jgi:hypothetical protein